MPRRNKRQTFEPIDYTPIDIIAAQAEAKRVQANRNWRNRPTWVDTARAERERLDRQETARINGGIDWSVCLVPGCGREITIHTRAEFGPSQRDHNTRLPLCYVHLATAHSQAIVLLNDPLMVAAAAAVLDIRKAEHEGLDVAAKRAWLRKTDGHIYFVRLNELVKVGWSREFASRLKAYGPDVEVLALYPGTRDDETALHRQLRPVLAKGREWYEDGPVVQRFINEAVEQHGPPAITEAAWTKPKQVVANKRVRR